MDEKTNMEVVDSQPSPEQKKPRNWRLEVIIGLLIAVPFILLIPFIRSMLVETEWYPLLFFGPFVGFVIYSLKIRGKISRTVIIIEIFFFFFVSNLAIAIFVPSIQYSRTLAQREQASENLRDIYNAIQAYLTKENLFPEDLNGLVQAGLISEETLQHPADKNPDIDFIVLPFTLSAKGEAMVGCERADFTDAGRAVLLSNGNVVWKEEESFQERLSDPKNKPLAEALQKAQTE